MKIAARLVGAGSVRRLARMEDSLAASALDAAAEALGREAGRAGEAASIVAPLIRGRTGGRLLIGTRDPAVPPASPSRVRGEGPARALVMVRAGRSRFALASADAQELGTLDQPPAPWLASVLPAARAKVRAAMKSVAARTLSHK
ncbi:MAG: hypothetical protein IT539_04165 [Bradyrhizobiaceae bacterium]|nr:hypothetical protein [Bradyrhizobiaceae bacterium]